MSRLLTLLICAALAMNVAGCGAESVVSNETKEDEPDLQEIYIRDEFNETSKIYIKLDEIQENLDESSPQIEPEVEPEADEQEEEHFEIEDDVNDVSVEENDVADVADDATEAEEIPNDGMENDDTSLKLTSDEEIMLQKLAYAEARSEGIDCMAAVMRVVLNRVEDNTFPNNISDVINQSGQFSPVSNGSYSSASPDDDTYQALEMVENGWDDSQGALYFESCSGSSWHSRNLQYLFSYGAIRFYK